jgi:hemerythrin-like domain-containing protein
MDAIEMLEEQHRDVEDLFEEFDQADASEKREIFEEIADQLSIHATIEEKHFYPAVRAKKTEDMVLEAFEEHLQIKRAISDCLDVEAKDTKQLEAKVKVLKEEVEHHVKEEEDELFPAAKKVLSADELLAVAGEMAATQDSLMEEGDPRDLVKEQLAQAPA